MNEWFNDFKTAVAFLTRLPMPHPDGAMPQNFVRAHRMFPVVGALIGASVGLLCLGLRSVGVPDLAAAALALGGSAILTGALHEDGLADVADGFGGGRDKAAKLEVMRDSRVGTYAVLVLVIAFVARVGALSALPRGDVILALTATHALARAPLAVLAATMAYAREGLAASVGRPEPSVAFAASLVAAVIAFLALPAGTAMTAILVAAAGATCFAVLAQRQIGGQTGDVLGAAEQVCEVAILLALAARLSVG